MKRSLINQPSLTETGEFEFEEGGRGGLETRRTEDGVVMTSKVLGGDRGRCAVTSDVSEVVQCPSSGSHSARANRIMHYQKIGT